MNTTTTRLRADNRPLYAQASERLRSLLQGGEYAPGTRLPSEPELAQRLGISRPTLREALQLLEEEGAIVRRHGVGTFVAEPRLVIDAGLEVLESLEQMAKRNGLHLEMGEVSICERPVSEEEAGRMGIAPSELATCVTRVILVEGKPVAHLADLLSVSVLRQSELGPDFHGSVLDTLVGRGWPALSHSRTELVSEAADRNLAQALHVARGAPLMKLDAQLFGIDGRVVDHSISHFVPGSFRFHVVRRIAGA